MKSETCDICGKRIDEYGTQFIKLDLVKNYQSQGYPATFSEKAIKCCVGCVGEAILKLDEHKVQLVMQAITNE